MGKRKRAANHRDFDELNQDNSDEETQFSSGKKQCSSQSKVTSTCCSINSAGTFSGVGLKCSAAKLESGASTDETRFVQNASLQQIEKLSNSELELRCPGEQPWPCSEQRDNSVSATPCMGGRSLRTSARVLSKQRREEEKDLLKKAELTDDEDEVPAETKKRRQWELWSAQDKDFFFEAINKCGKNFKSLQTFLMVKIRKKGVPNYQIKNKDQVRHFYYRTWHKISKYIAYNGVAKKSAQEVYGLVNYGEFRKRVGGTLDAKRGTKLRELVLHGSTSVRFKGRTIRIRTPFCRALKRFHQSWEKRVESERTPRRLSVCLSAASNSAWARVQGFAHNPRVRAQVPLDKPVRSLLDHLNKKWRAAQLKMRDFLAAQTRIPLVVPHLPEVFLRILPPPNAPITVVSFKQPDSERPVHVSLLSYESWLQNMGSHTGAGKNVRKPLKRSSDPSEHHNEQQLEDTRGESQEDTECSDGDDLSGEEHQIQEQFESSSPSTHPSGCPVGSHSPPVLSSSSLPDIFGNEEQDRFCATSLGICDVKSGERTSGEQVSLECREQCSAATSDKNSSCDNIASAVVNKNKCVSSRNVAKASLKVCTSGCVDTEDDDDENDEDVEDEEEEDADDEDDEEDEDDELQKLEFSQQKLWSNLDAQYNLAVEKYLPSDVKEDTSVKIDIKLGLSAPEGESDTAKDESHASKRGDLTKHVQFSDPLSISDHHKLELEEGNTDVPEMLSKQVCGDITSVCPTSERNKLAEEREAERKISVLRQGWTLDNVGGLSFGELFVMLGKKDPLQLIYEFEPEKESDEMKNLSTNLSEVDVSVKTENEKVFTTVQSPQISDSGRDTEVFPFASCPGSARIGDTSEGTLATALEQLLSMSRSLFQNKSLLLDGTLNCICGGTNRGLRSPRSSSATSGAFRCPRAGVLHCSPKTSTALRSPRGTNSRSPEVVSRQGPASQRIKSASVKCLIAPTCELNLDGTKELDIQKPSSSVTNGSILESRAFKTPAPPPALPQGVTVSFAPHIQMIPRPSFTRNRSRSVVRKNVVVPRQLPLLAKDGTTRPAHSFVHTQACVSKPPASTVSSSAAPLNAISVNVSGMQLLTVQLPPQTVNSSAENPSSSSTTSVNVVSVKPSPYAAQNQASNLLNDVANTVSSATSISYGSGTRQSVIKDLFSEDSLPSIPKNSTNISPSRCREICSTPATSPSHSHSILTTPKMTLPRRGSVDAPHLEKATNNISNEVSSDFSCIPQLHIPDDSNSSLPLLDISLSASFGIDDSRIQVKNGNKNPRCAPSAHTLSISNELMMTPNGAITFENLADALDILPLSQVEKFTNPSSTQLDVAETSSFDQFPFREQNCLSDCILSVVTCQQASVMTSSSYCSASGSSAVLSTHTPDVKSSDHNEDNINFDDRNMLSTPLPLTENSRDKFFDELSIGSSTFSNILAPVEVNPESATLNTPPRISSESVATSSGQQSVSSWLSAEAPDISLTSLLGFLDGSSPTKRHDSPQPPTTILAALNENGVDFTAEFGSVASDRK